VSTLAIDRVATIWTQIKATEGNTAARTWDEIAEHFEYSLPHRALVFHSLENLVHEVSQSGSFYWTKDAITTHGPLVVGRFWVESKQFHPGPYSSEADSAPRTYAVAWVYQAPTTDILQIEKVGEMSSVVTAREMCGRLAYAVKKAI
jgi:hypothetical protein